MKTPASSSAAKRRARNVNKLQRQSQQPAPVPAKSLDQLTPIPLQAAGIDVGSAENYVAIPAEGLAAGESPVRVFGVFSAEQDALLE